MQDSLPEDPVEPAEDPQGVVPSAWANIKEAFPFVYSIPSGTMFTGVSQIHLRALLQEGDDGS